MSAAVIASRLLEDEDIDPKAYTMRALADPIYEPLNLISFGHVRNWVEVSVYDGLAELKIKRVQPSSGALRRYDLTLKGHEPGRGDFIQHIISQRSTTVPRNLKKIATEMLRDGLDWWRQAKLGWRLYKQHEKLIVAPGLEAPWFRWVTDQEGQAAIESLPNGYMEQTPESVEQWEKITTDFIADYRGT